MRTVTYLRWSPSASPLRVEFPPALLQEVTRESGGNGWGVLYGTRHGLDVRVLASRRQEDDPANRHLPWAVAGVYFCRPRGPVFLTEEDLGRFLDSDAEIALVICGNRAGFFVREHDGSVDSLSSCEEFDVPKVAARKPPSQGHKVASRQPQFAQIKRDWGFRVAAAAAFLSIPLAGMPYLKPLLAQPANLTLREQAGQVQISWNPNAVRRGGELEIADGGSTSRTRILPGQSSTTFLPENHSITVTVRTEPDLGFPHRESAFRVMETSPPPPPVAETTNLEEILALEQQVTDLRASVEAGQGRLIALEWAIRNLRAQLASY